MTTQTRTWTYEPVGAHTLRHFDLRQELGERIGAPLVNSDPLPGRTGPDHRDLSGFDADAAEAWRESVQAYRVTIEGSAEQAEVLVIDDERIGIAWGADATWGDVRDGDVEAAIEDWLNDEAAWDSRR